MKDCPVLTGRQKCILRPQCEHASLVAPLGTWSPVQCYGGGASLSWRSSNLDLVPEIKILLSQTGWRFENGKPRGTSSQNLLSRRFELGSKQKNPVRNKSKMSVSRGTSLKMRRRTRFETKGWRFESDKLRGTSSQKWLS